MDHCQMELSPLRSFLVLAREQNVTRAAAALHLTQPAVSSQLARLETELGLRLFDRSSRGVQLTPAGQVFRGHVENALTALEAGERALQELAGLEQGSLALGGGATATNFLFPSLLGEFHRQHPSIRLFVREQGSQGVASAVLAGELDLGVVTLPLGESSQHELRRLEVEPWLTDELLLLVPPHHPLARKRSFRWTDLDEAPMVLFEAGSAVRNLIDAQLAAAGVRVEIVMELRSIAAIKQMVAQGIGAAFVSRFTLSQRKEGLYCADGPLERQLGLVYHAERTLTPAAEAFIQVLRENSGR